MDLLGDVGHVESHFSPLRIILDEPDAQVESRFGQFLDSANPDVR